MQLLASSLEGEAKRKYNPGGWSFFSFRRQFVTRESAQRLLYRSIPELDRRRWLHHLPATAVGVDAEWGAGHWNINAEWQHFRMDYTAISPFTTSTGYGEIRFVVLPSWYLATRIGYMSPSAIPLRRSYEAAVGYPTGKNELVN